MNAEAYFEDLLVKVIEGVADEEEFAIFMEIVRRDADLRMRYAQEMRFHAILSYPKEGEGQKECARAGVGGTRNPKSGEEPRPPCAKGALWNWWKAAATLAVLAGGAAVWCAKDLGTLAGPGPRSGRKSASAVPVLRVMDQKNVRGLSLPDTVPGLLRLESGEVVVRLETGVELTLLGPVAVDIRDNMSVHLERGKLLANVPHWATGFTVWTAELEIYDLGTIFSVNAAEGVSDVFVFKGSVQVNEAGFNERGREKSGSGVGICEAGEGVRAVGRESPVKIETDWLAAQKMFLEVQGDAAVKSPAEALETAGRIADLWTERYVPGPNLLSKKVVAGSGITFEKTARVRAVAPRQEEAGNMNKASVTAALAATVVLMGAGAADADPVTNIAYRNDFGTDAQFTALTWSTDTNGLALLSDIGPNPPGDLDGDSLFRAVRCANSAVTRYGTKAFYAPVFSVLSNPTVAGYGTGDAVNFASWARWGLSRNGGTTFDYSVTTDNSRTWKFYSTLAQAHGDANYTRTRIFYATAALQYGSGGTYSAGGAGKTAAFQVDVDVLPAQLGERVYIHLNDFGTEAQSNAWTYSGGLTFVNKPTYDTDTDQLAKHLRFDTVNGTRYATIQIVAPEGKFFRCPIATGLGGGNLSSWNSGAQIQLSLDGAKWDVLSTIPTSTTYTMTADGSSVAAYDRPLSSVWLRIRLYAGNPGGIRPWAGLVTVSAEMAIPRGTLVTFR